MADKIKFVFHLVLFCLLCSLLHTSTPRMLQRSSHRNQATDRSCWAFHLKITVLKLWKLLKIWSKPAKFGKQEVKRTISGWGQIMCLWELYNVNLELSFTNVVVPKTLVLRNILSTIAHCLKFNVKIKGTVEGRFFLPLYNECLSDALRLKLYFLTFNLWCLFKYLTPIPRPLEERLAQNLLH